MKPLTGYHLIAGEWMSAGESFRSISLTGPTLEVSEGTAEHAALFKELQ